MRGGAAGRGSGRGGPGALDEDEGIRQVVSSDGTVTVTNPLGPIVDVEVTNPLPAFAAPVSVDKSANAAGAAATISRSDHKHDVQTAVPTGEILIGAAALEGVATTLARSDHEHPMLAPVADPLPVAAVANVGASTTAAKEDHVHAGVTSVNGAQGAVVISTGGGGTPWYVENVAALLAATGIPDTDYKASYDDFNTGERWVQSGAIVGTGNRGADVDGVFLASGATANSSIIDNWSGAGAGTVGYIRKIQPAGGGIKWGFAVRFKVATAVDAQTVLMLGATDSVDDFFFGPVFGPTSAVNFSALLGVGGVTTPLTSTIAIDNNWHTLLVYTDGVDLFMQVDAEAAQSFGVDAAFVTEPSFIRQAGNGTTAADRKIHFSQLVYVVPAS